MPMAASKNRYTLVVIEDDEPLNPREDYDNFGKMACWHSRYNLGDKHDFESPDEFLADLIRRTTNTNDVVSYIKDGNDPDIKVEYNKSTHEWEMNVFDSHFKKWYTEETFEAPLDKDYGDVRDCILQYMSISKMLEIAEKNNCIMPLYLYDHSGITMSTAPFSCPWDSGQVGWIYADKDTIEKEYGSVTPETMEKARELLESEVKTYDYYLTNQCYGYQLFDGDTEIDSCWGFLGEISDIQNELKEYLPEGYEDLADKLEFDYGKFDIDDYHLMCGSNVLHICQLAELMERNKTQYAPIPLPDNMPYRCYTTVPSSGELVLLKYGETGYFKCKLLNS